MIQRILLSSLLLSYSPINAQVVISKEKIGPIQPTISKKIPTLLEEGAKMLEDARDNLLPTMTTQLKDMIDKLMVKLPEAEDGIKKLDVALKQINDALKKVAEIKSSKLAPPKDLIASIENSLQSQLKGFKSAKNNLEKFVVTIRNLRPSPQNYTALNATQNAINTATEKINSFNLPWRMRTAANSARPLGI